MSRIRVRNQTCWKRCEMWVKPELTPEIELQTCNKNLFITIHLMDQTENGKQNKPDCNLFIYWFWYILWTSWFYTSSSCQRASEIILPPPPSQHTIWLPEGVCSLVGEAGNMKQKQYASQTHSGPNRAETPVPWSTGTGKRFPLEPLILPAITQMIFLKHLPIHSEDTSLHLGHEKNTSL